ncbi:hypothetical protein Enr17x_10040 [Gimesia fumaroli]|uniref:Uncharacterized protein n=1 Tax=Gimesia fumaroli TaxID=2527976 RepID=A0A518I7D9_9PLAN|nr:hypothetical protein Enr17x_10040 [Gimesia fumaroli]
MFVNKIIVNGVGESRGVRIYSLGSFYEAPGLRSETLRCRLITEVRVSSGLGNRAETSGFYGAGFFSDSDISAEPVVFSRATLTTLHHSKRREAVKMNLFSRAR